MIDVVVSYHKDGDHLVIVEKPWFYDILDWFTNLICPCHGVIGWLSGKSDRVEAISYKVWSSLLIKLTDKFQKEIYKTPIRSGCEASISIWKEDDKFCWRDDCEFHEEEEETTETAG